jgi:ribosomal protein S18 acetylase RimI-like enzyme
MYGRTGGVGGGGGRRLVERLLDEVRHIGYARVRLDSLSTMTAATALYRSVGFVSCERYYDTPLAETVFMELVLSDSP